MTRCLLLVVLLLVAGCSDSTEPAETSQPPAPPPASTTSSEPPQASTEATTTSSTTTEPPLLIPEQLTSFPTTSITIGESELLVAVADTGATRRQGLMNVADLLDLDGMLFVFAQDTDGGFWMKDTLLPLDIAFFAADGTYVDGFAMEPCTTVDCPTYRPTGRYRYAVEVPAGEMPAPDGRLQLDL